MKRDSKLSRTGALAAGTAAALAASALYNTYQARRVERRHPPAGRFVTIDGVRLHYLERGDGPAVVLLHGNVVTAEDYVWSGVFDRVAERHRVVTIDRPGFGYSERPRGTLWTPAAQADLLRRALARLGLDRPVVVGHSWGALVALALALNHPATVRGLVLLSGFYKPTVRADVPLVAPPAIPVLGDVMRYTVSPLLGTALLPLGFKAMFAPLPLPAHFRRHFPRGFPLRPSQIRAQAQDAVTMVPAIAAMRKRYPELQLPVTIMAGTHDRVVDVDGHARWFHEAIPHSELRLISEAGHMFHYAVPEQVADAIAAASDGRRVTGGSDPAGRRPPAAGSVMRHRGS